MKIFSLLGKFIAEFFFFIFAYAAGILFLIAWGRTESLGLLAELMAGFIVVSLLRNYVWRRIFRKHRETRKQIFLECAVYIAVLQAVLIFVVPMSSLVPKTILARAGVVHPLEGMACNVDQRLEMMKSLWGSQIDFRKVHLVEGGLMYNVRQMEKKNIIKSGYARAAMAFGNTIYFADISPCPADYIYFHEMTHIWQQHYARDLTFGWRTIPEKIRNTYKQFTDSGTLYNFGGVAGLRAAREAGKLFSDFGEEQQAMIVEDRYSANAGYTISPDGEEFTEEYKELLEYYVQNMLDSR